MTRRRFGPAGIFSTDDPVADSRQIMAEEWVDSLEEEEQFWKEYDPRDEEDDQYDQSKDDESVYRVFFCDTPQDFYKPWWSQTAYLESEEEEVIASMQEKHDSRCNCGNPISNS